MPSSLSAPSPIEGPAMTKSLHGKVNGRTIELDEDPNMAEGQDVEVQIRIINRPSHTPGEGLLRTEGALANDTEWDAIMDEIHQARNLEQRPQTPDLVEP